MGEDEEAKAWRPILDQLLAPGGLALAFTGLALGLVSIFILPDWKVPAQMVVCLAIITLAYVWISMAALTVAKRRVRAADARPAVAQEPRVKHINVAAQGDELTLLLEPSRLFGQSMLVSVYYEDERGYEVLAASGRVATIQSNGFIQIAVTAWQEGQEALRTDLLNQQSAKLAKLMVRAAPVTDTPDLRVLTPDLLRRLFFIPETVDQGSADD